MLSKIKKKFRENVKGPVFPIPTCFTKNGQVDYQGIQRYVGFLLTEGAKTLMVTVGTSRFDVLTVEEMLKINETVVEAAQGKAVTIVTTPKSGPTSQAIEFAVHAENMGADGILAVYPGRFYSEESVYQFFSEISASCSIGIFIHEMSMTSGLPALGTQVNYSIDLVERIEKISNLVGLKEESRDPNLIYQFNRKLGDKLLIIGGAGGMRSFLTARQWGQPAYLVGIGNFYPDIELEFFSALSTGDYERAHKIVFDIEEPFFEAAVKVGWHLALKEALHALNLMTAWERSPMARLPKALRQTIRSHVVSGNPEGRH